MLYMLLVKPFLREKDIFFELTSAEGLEFSGILRWGKGAGFSNLRLDLR